MCIYCRLPPGANGRCSPHYATDAGALFRRGQGPSRIASSPARSFPRQSVIPEYGNSLAIDHHLSDFSVYPSTAVDMELIEKFPQVFSTLYHYIPEHLDREVFVRVTYLMLNLLHLRHTAFLLLRDSKLGFPESLLERIADLKLPFRQHLQPLGRHAVPTGCFSLHKTSG